MLFAFLPIVAPVVLVFEGFRTSLALYDGIMAGLTPPPCETRGGYSVEGNVIRLV